MAYCEEMTPDERMARAAWRQRAIRRFLRGLRMMPGGDHYGFHAGGISPQAVKEVAVECLDAGCEAGVEEILRFVDTWAHPQPIRHEVSDIGWTHMLPGDLLAFTVSGAERDLRLLKLTHALGRIMTPDCRVELVEYRPDQTFQRGTAYKSTGGKQVLKIELLEPPAVCRDFDRHLLNGAYPESHVGQIADLYNDLLDLHAREVVGENASEVYDRLSGLGISTGTLLAILDFVTCESRPPST